MEPDDYQFILALLDREIRQYRKKIDADDFSDPKKMAAYVEAEKALLKVGEVLGHRFGNLNLDLDPSGKTIGRLN